MWQHHAADVVLEGGEVGGVSAAAEDEGAWDFACRPRGGGAGRAAAAAAADRRDRSVLGAELLASGGAVLRDVRALLALLVVLVLD